MTGLERVDQKVSGFQQMQPISDQDAYAADVQLMMDGRKRFQVGLGELEQGGGGAEPVLLQVHKGPGELDQALVKISIGTFAVRQPKIFQNIVRLIELLFVEEHEITGISRVHAFAAELGGQRGDALGFGNFAHDRRLSIFGRKTNNLKSNGLRRNVA